MTNTISEEVLEHIMKEVDTTDDFNDAEVEDFLIDAIRMTQDKTISEFERLLKEEINEKNLYNISSNNLKTLYSIIYSIAKEMRGEKND